MAMCITEFGRLSSEQVGMAANPKGSPLLDSSWAWCLVVRDLKRSSHRTSLRDSLIFFCRCLESGLVHVLLYRTPPQIASLVTTAVIEVATGARRMSGQDRLAMGPG